MAGGDNIKDGTIMLRSANDWNFIVREVDVFITRKDWL